MKSPIVYFGGKSYSRKTIIPILEGIPHKRFIDVFGGGGSIILGKEPVSVEVYNDIDGGVYDLFCTLREDESFDKFYRFVSLTGYGRQFHSHAKNTRQNEKEQWKRAALYYIENRQSFGGKMDGSWSMSASLSRRGMAGTCSRWLSSLDILPEFTERLRCVQIENYDFRKLFPIYDSSESLFYCDPPYIMDTRKCAGYTCEIVDNDHRDLVDLLLNMQGKAVLSGYAHEIYQPLEDAGWLRKDFSVVSSAAGKTRASGLQGKGNAVEKQKRTETLWIKQ